MPIKLAVSSGHCLLPPGQPVLALTLEHVKIVVFTSYFTYPVVWLTVGAPLGFYNQLSPLLVVLSFPQYDDPFKVSPLPQTALLA